MSNLTLQEQLEIFKNTTFVGGQEERHENKFEDKINDKSNDKNIHSNNINNKEVVMYDRHKYDDLQWGDVLYVDLDNYGIGSEQKGIRYAIVIQNDIGNKYSPTIIVALVTSQINKAKLPLIHVEIPAGNFGLPKDSVVLLEQIRTLDKRRIKRHVGKIDEITSIKIARALGNSTARKLEKKTELEKLPNETKQYIINRIRFIERAKESIEFYKSIKADNYSIDFAEDEKFKEENALKYYCYKNQIDYIEIWNNYEELERRKEESVAL
jgi:mRNA interferase MazF